MKITEIKSVSAHVKISYESSVTCEGSIITKGLTKPLLSKDILYCVTLKLKQHKRQQTYLFLAL